MGPITTRSASAALASGDPAEISLALLRLALHGPDWGRAEQLAREHASHPEVWVRRNAATALGHVARVHGSLDIEQSLPALTKLLDDAEVSDWADAALDDVEIYMGVKRGGSATVSGVGYDEGAQILEVEFMDGALHRYLRVPAEEFTRLRRASSLGCYLNSQIRPRYRHRKVRKARVVELLRVHADRIAA
jgi:hypothetical protein